MSRAVEQAYERIKLDILAGVHPVGGRLKEEDLAEQAGVSRTPVREALRRLNAEGIVDFRPNQGAFVSDWSAQDIREIFDLRTMLEGYGARLAAERITPEAIAELEHLAHRIEKAADRQGPDFLETISRDNDRFHKIILESAANRRLQRMLASIVEMPLVLRTFGIYTDQQLRRSLQHHRELIAALRARDGEWARTVMECHIRAACSAYFAAAQRGCQAAVVGK